MNNTQSMNVNSNSNSLGGFPAGMFPLYYIPTQERNLEGGNLTSPLAQSRFQGINKKLDTIHLQQMKKYYR